MRSNSKYMSADNTPPKSILVRDLMTVGVPTCPADFPIGNLAKTMLERDWEAVVVLEKEQGHAVGVVGRAELASAFTKNVPRDTPAEEIMRERLVTLPPDIPVLAAAQIMLDEGVRAAYITHHAGGIEYPAAWLTFTHFLRHLVGDDLSDLGIRAAREKPLDTFFRRRDEARKRGLQNKSGS
jgi:CBS domain-containing protein